jgi:hypothetical protein
MKQKRLLITIGISFVVAMMIGLLGLETVFAQECRLIKIHGRSEHPSLAIEPETSFISKGDCVVWFNRVFTDEVQIIFDDGKKCLDVSKSPMGFSLDAQSCYVTSWMPFAGTSSLRFMEKGTYGYVVKTKSWKGIQAKGHIIVE